MVPENVDRKDDGRSGGKDRRPRSGDRRDYRENRDRHGPGIGRKDFRRDDRRGGGGRPRDGKGRDPGNGRSGAGNRPGQRPSNRTGRDGRPSDRRPRDDRRKPEGIPEHKPRDAPEPSLTIPSTPQRILFKGVDCEVNGRTDLAMILYLHGAAMLSKGCENNMTRMLREAGPEQFRTIRGRVAKVCPENAMIAFDYMCYTLDPGYDRSLLDSAAENGNPLAIYERIRLPKRATSGSAGYDFFAPVRIELAPGETVKIPTGIRVWMEPEWVLKCYPRSGLGFKFRLQLNNTVGIIDSDYYDSDNEGHIFAKLTNDSNEGKTVEVRAGDGFMQGIFVEYGITLDDDVTEVRNGGFGSTTKE